MLLDRMEWRYEKRNKHQGGLGVTNNTKVTMKGAYYLCPPPLHTRIAKRRPPLLLPPGVLPAFRAFQSLTCSLPATFLVPPLPLGSQSDSAGYPLYDFHSLPLTSSDTFTTAPVLRAISLSYSPPLPRLWLAQAEGGGVAIVIRRTCHVTRRCQLGFSYRPTDTYLEFSQAHGSALGPAATTFAAR